MGHRKYLESDLIGKTFHYLTIIREVEKIRYRRRMEAKCVCGVIKNYDLAVLLGGHTQSCGCKMVELRKPSVIKHGLVHHDLNRKYHSMKARCYNKNAISYKRYGGRGIKLCNEWVNDFKSFYDWSMANGYKEGLTIERIDNDGNYEPNNCRWATMKEQSRNRRNTVVIIFRGEAKLLCEWAEQFGMPYEMVRQRIDRGWDIEKALTVSPNEYTINRKNYLSKWR